MTRMTQVVAGVVLVALVGCVALGAAIVGLVATDQQQDSMNPCTDPGAVVPVSGGKPIDVTARAVLDAGWSTSDAITAVAVAEGESGHNPLAANPDSTARGLFQIMLSYHQPKFRGADWRDPFANARVAHQIWADAGGWSPWVVHTTGAYREHLPAARAAVARVTGSTEPVAYTRDAACVTDAVLGSVVHPMPPGTYVAQDNWGNAGAHWSNGHTGTDFSAPCGTPVRAVTGGTIEVDTTQSWSGRWLVKVSTGAGRLSTWYAHMESLAVEAAQTVAAGQTIGTVGSEGNSTGCHLHFEVHPNGGSIYEDNVNPTTWLAENLGKSIGGTLPVKYNTGGTVVASFNVLGSSHTKGPGGKAPGPARIRAVPDLLADYGVSLVGFQEFEGNQKRAFLAATRGEWATWHRPGDPVNAVAWRTDTWTKVGHASVDVPYFYRDKAMPAILVEHTTGPRVWILNVHNPADTRGPAAHKRRTAVTRELGLVARLHDTAPVLYVGDMNDRDAFYCPATRAGMRAANGGSNGTGPCRTPPNPGVDWIMGTPEVTFSGYRAVRSPVVQRISDHPLITATIH